MRVLLLLLLLWQPGQAWAHAALLEAAPEDGAALDSAPGPVRLRFDEPVSLISLTLAGPHGAVAPVQAPAVDGDVLSARFPADLPRGTYLLSWRVTSVDSHPVAGTIAFGVGVPAAAHGGPAPQRWLLASVAVRALFLGTLLVAAGGALFRLVAEPPWRRALVWVAWGGVALAVLQVGLRGALLADAPGLLAPGTWALGAGTTLAASLLVSALGLAGCAFTLRTRYRWVGVASAVVAAAGLPLSGHAGTADPRWLTAPALLLHGVAAAFWIGALVPLLGVLRHGVLGRGGAEAVRRFSAGVVYAVAALLLSGATLAAVQLGSAAGLESGYGQVLLLKLAGVAGLLALAAWNRWRVTPALLRGGRLRWNPAGALQGSIRAELGLAAAVLAVTAVLGLVPPPRAEAHPARTDRAAWTMAGGIPATIAVDPARPGRNRFSVTIGRGAPPREVTLELRLPGAGVAAVRRPMHLIDGAWTFEGPEMALPGRWSISAEALLTDFDQATFTTEMTIP